MFADRIMDESGEETRGLRALLPTTTLLETSNVADLFAAEFRAGRPSTDLPSLAPPWPRFWVEQRTPRSFAQAPGPELLPGWGVLVEAHEVEGFAPMSLPGTFAARVREAFARRPTARWALCCSLYLDFGRMSDAIRGGSAVIAVDGDGSGEADWDLRPEHIQVGDLPPEHRELGGKVRCLMPLWSALLSISFIHCRNVTAREVVPPEKLSRARERRKGIPLLSYHVLEIEPMTRVLRGEGRADELGLKQALHICRGHFAEYGAAFGKGKLFGRQEGRFWVPMHVRGDAREGVVAKDYRVAGPDGKAAR